MPRKSPVWEDSYEKGAWMSMFPGVLHSEQGSLSHVKKLIAVGFSCITFLRNVFPQVAYEIRVVDNLHVAVLLEDCGIPCPNLFVDLLYSAFDAIEKKYLRELSLVFFDENCEVVQEVYTFRIKYLKNGEATLTKLSCSNSLNIDEKMDVKGQTLNLLRAIIVLTQSMKPLPNNIAIQIYVNYYERVTPRKYQPTGFKSVAPLPCEIEEPFSLKVGCVKMLTHTVQLRATLQHTRLEENVTIALQSDKKDTGAGADVARSKNESFFISPEGGPVTCHFSGLDDQADLQMTSFCEDKDITQDTNDNAEAEVSLKQVKNLQRTPLSSGLESTASLSFLQKSEEDGIFSRRHYRSSKCLSSSSSELSLEGLIRCPCGLKGEDDIMITCKYCGHRQHGACFRILFISELPVFHVCELCTQPGRPCTDPLLGSSCPRKVRETCILRRVYAHLSKVPEQNNFESLANHFGLEKQVADMVFGILYADGAFFAENHHNNGMLVNKGRLISCLIPRYFHPRELPMLYDGERVQASELLAISQIFQEEELSTATTGKGSGLPSSCRKSKEIVSYMLKADEKHRPSHDQEENEDEQDERETASRITDEESLRLRDFEISEVSLLDDSILESVEMGSDGNGLGKSFQSYVENEDIDSVAMGISLENTLITKTWRKKSVQDIIEEDNRDLKEMDLVSDSSSNSSCSLHSSKDVKDIVGKMTIGDQNFGSESGCLALPVQVTEATEKGDASSIDRNLGQYLDCDQSENKGETMQSHSDIPSQLLKEESHPDGITADLEIQDQCIKDTGCSIHTSKVPAKVNKSNLVLKRCHVSHLAVCNDSPVNACKLKFMNKHGSDCPVDKQTSVTGNNKVDKIKRNLMPSEVLSNGSTKQPVVKNNLDNEVALCSSYNKSMNILQMASVRSKRSGRKKESRNKCERRDISTSIPESKYLRSKAHSSSTVKRQYTPYMNTEKSEFSMASENNQNDTSGANDEVDGNCSWLSSPCQPDMPYREGYHSEDLEKDPRSDGVDKSSGKETSSSEKIINTPLSFQMDSSGNSGTESLSSQEPLSKFSGRKDRNTKFFHKRSDGIAASKRKSVSLCNASLKPKFFKSKFETEQRKTEYWSNISSYGEEEEKSEADLHPPSSLEDSTIRLPVWRRISNGNCSKDPYAMTGSFDVRDLPTAPKRRKICRTNSLYEDFSELGNTSKIPWKYFKMSKRKRLVSRIHSASV